MTHPENESEPSPDQQIELSRRLAAVTEELEEIARRRLRRLPNSWTPGVERRSESLETEADDIRAQLGNEPAIGRPPKRSWAGWAILAVCLVGVFIGVLRLVVPV